MLFRHCGGGYTVTAEKLAADRADEPRGDAGAAPRGCGTPAAGQRCFPPAASTQRERVPMTAARPRHPRPRCPPEQPQGRRFGSAARRAARGHRGERVREVLARVRHRVQRGAAPLRRDVLLLRPPVPRPDGQAPVRRVRRHRRHPALHRHRPDEPGADLALDGRHHDRAQRSPEAAVRASRGAALPGLRNVGPPRHAAFDHERDS